MGMNINALRRAVVKAQQATLDAQSKAYDIYDSRTGEDTSEVRSSIKRHKDALELVAGSIVNVNVEAECAKVSPADEVDGGS